MAAPSEQLLHRVPTCHAAEALPPLPLLTPPRVARRHFPVEVGTTAPGLPTASRRRSDQGGPDPAMGAPDLRPRSAADAMAGGPHRASLLPRGRC
jgi:hypothetical protein